VGASVGVAGALLGMFDGGFAELIADIAFQSSQLTTQSQMSPSEYDSSIDVPVTSTGSP
jgi:hypothetical protein